VSERLFQDDPGDRAAWAAAEAARAGGDRDLEFDQLSRLLRRRLARRQGLSIADRVAAERLADLATVLRQVEAAGHLLAGVEAANRAAGYLFAADWMALKRGHLSLEAGALDEALGRLRGLEARIGPLSEVPWQADEFPAWEARCRWPGDRGSAGDRGWFFAGLYLVMGQYQAAQGRYGHAAVLLDRGIQQAREPAANGAVHALPPLMLALAGVLLEQGRLEECERRIAPLADHLESSENLGWRTRWLELRGHMGLLRGCFGTALDAFARVTAICTTAGPARAALGAMFNQAEVLIIVNQVGAAEELLGEAATLARALSDAVAERRIAWLSGLADARARSLAAEVSITPSLTEIWRGMPPAGGASAGRRPHMPPDPPASPNFLEFFCDRALAVQWALATGDVAEARQRLRDMLHPETFGDAESPLIRLRLHALDALVAYAERDHRRAARLLEAVSPLFERLGLKPDLWQALRLRTWCAGQLPADEVERAALEQRTRDLVEEMARSLPPAQMAVYLLNKWTIEEKALKVEIDQLTELRARADAAGWMRRPIARWRLRKHLYEFLHRLDENRRRHARRVVTGNGAAGPAPEAAIPWWRWLWRQPRDAANVSFLVLPDRVFTACSRRWSLEFGVCGLTRVELRRRVGEWHDLAARYFQGESVPREAFEDRARSLAHDLQLTPLLQRLPRRVRHLTITADDSLHGFPFAAMRLGDFYLVERFAAVTSYDRTASHPPRPAPPGRALVVAISRGTDEIPELKSTIAEAEQVERWLQGRGVAVDRLVDDGASRAAVVEAFPRAGLVHIACHGLFRPDRPDASGLALIPREETVELLAVRDLATLALDGVEHVTLSSCWGADSFVLPGRWIVGLPETLCRRGAASVLASLWPVDDRLGPALIRLLYRRLERLPRDRALRAVQRKLLKDRLWQHRYFRGAIPIERRFSTSHPYYWAGLVLHGERGRLRVGAPGPWR
jgi:CHAT domain-containing protein